MSEFIRTNAIRVKNVSGGTIPANSFVKVTDYNITYNYFEIDQPDADNLLCGVIFFLPDSLANNIIGLAYSDGIAWIKPESGHSIVAGDKVGTKEDSWEAKEVADDSYGHNAGQYRVLYVNTTDDILLVRARVMESFIWSVP